MTMAAPTLLIHGGADASGALDEGGDATAYLEALRATLTAGERVLADGGSAVDAVTEAVRLLEECPLFNAGHGAVFTQAGGHELDASIMDGATRRCGAVANVQCVRNPVLAARAVMEQGRHVLLVGTGAEAFARTQGLECVEPTFFSTERRRRQLAQAQRTGAEDVALGADGTPHESREGQHLGTVGAVALDRDGNLAAATSTGGTTNKLPGRVGDSPIIGAGCYADNRTCAVSCTGKGEAFMRAVAAYDVAALMEYAALDLMAAAEREVFTRLPASEGAGGLIAVDAAGHIAMPFNSAGMYRGSVVVGKSPQVAIDKPR